MLRRVIPSQWLGASGTSHRSRLDRMRQEQLGHATKWKENAFGKWKLLPRLGDDARVSGSQRLSQKPLALPLRVDVRRIEKSYSGIYCSRDQRQAFTTRA